MKHPHLLFTLFVLAGHSSSTLAHPDSEENTSEELEILTVKGRDDSLFGEAISASEGYISQEEIAKRPLLRTGEVLELVPGMVVTQHSGSGKANQYFLRGFNLDHGTDFATFVDGMPVNFRTHGHGQGYTDLNFIIPELVGSLQYKKGAYYTEVGDFSGAGSAHLSTVSKSPNSKVSVTAGEFGYLRGFFMQDTQIGEGNLVYAIEHQKYDGPWTDIEEDVNKTNVFVKYSQAVLGGNLSVSFMGYDNEWNSADQIPLRAVEQGLISRFGSIDTTLGGESSRYSLNAIWESDTLRISAYAIDYDFTLYSNFTFFLENPEFGDQFEQVDSRRVYGGEINKTLYGTLGQYNTVNTFGLQFRTDDIDEVGLFETTERVRRGAVRLDTVNESSYSAFWDNQTLLSDKLRVKIGARYDFFTFDVDSLIETNINNVNVGQNNGTENDGLLSVKGSIIYSINDHFEAYASAGQGFHSNDARGTISSLDPVSGDTITPVDPLVSSFGYELGLKANINHKINASLALWTLDLDSELVFVGDAGNTEASGASSRYGVEATVYYHPTEDWTVNLEYAYTDSEFSDEPSSANAIPGSINEVFQAGVTYEQPTWFASAQYRYFGDRPLIEDESAVSDPSRLTNLRLGITLSPQTNLTFDILNVFNSNDSDIDYFYESQLPGETEPVEDIHLHVLQPRSIRVGIEYQF
ncbi:TonB-dependent receptor [Alteromonas sp. 5E99-2]|uniref:TonB-dependent receptor n=1 Tax=Alteromonas sp. 5E99-2 TaxID=2817683 RepID=UPI001A98E240|nr:TonB-dependent receptor [Alteromonas sp. 5E99-2]MBO1254214.1 TonB-dependent receptor [Alteromonas sp. 5E99-2]